MRNHEDHGPLARACALLLGGLAGAGVPVRVEHPAAAVGVQSGAFGGPWLAVWPYAVLPEALPVRPGDPLRLRVRFLLHADGPDATAIEALDRVLMAGVPYLLAEPVPDTLWPALGARLRAALLCEVAVQVTNPAPAAPRVTQPARLDAVSLRRLAGRVQTPAGIALVGMRVAAEDGTAAAYTDTRGRFELPVVDGRPVRLAVSGRGLLLTAEVPAASAEPVVITCEIQEVQ
ncbi:hypothetical protein [Catellatospora bangladeshensis]|uniref:Carboxypeptidase regulatory-like domain-containing protein n=1 Tax=Catellatospora bangladeshensis TaxID=310355 RepID=A0A8J3JL87_9ACTN|nr:hypothetical protein [Catellatospora bangladeshensis]GIF82696.1 hypothetical protein Cba03nite_40450 [Catellatospora bangladeshensis]